MRAAALLRVSRISCLARPSSQMGNGGKRFITMAVDDMPTEKLVKVTVNGMTVKVPDTATVMQACAIAGVDVPRFCYHERLGVAGNCRMCLVQVNEGPKLMASCAAPIMPEMRIATESPAVKKAREGVMEFLLANHPLDCPICDQGGECDLQDQAMAFGADRSRFQISHQDKRAVEDKDFGPLVKTSMNRCIHCTRCVRFANEVAGAPELGTTGRGNDMQIGTYIGQMLNSPLSGNIIDLCPVGALTSRPYAFTARPWELRHTDSIDVFDAMGANIKVDSRGMEVLRILPRLNEQINEEWLADKSRFAYDGLRQQRLVQPIIRASNGNLTMASWEDALKLVSDRMMATPASSISGVVGRFADLESTFLLKTLLQSLGAEEFLLDGSIGKNSKEWPKEFLKELRFTTTIAGVESADAILLVGCNPRIEAPLLEARIRKTWLRKNVAIGLIGDNKACLTFDYDYLGEDFTALDRILLDKMESSSSSSFSKKLATAQRLMVIFGQDSIFAHPDSSITLNRIVQLAKKYKSLLFGEEGWSGINMLPLTAGVTGALMLGATPAIPSGKFLYLLNADDFDPSKIPADAFVVYQGHHGDVGASRADVILPGAAYTEKMATYVNMEGRPQQTRVAVPPPGEAREDWTILRALSEFLGVTLPWEDIDAVQNALSQQYPSLGNVNMVAPSQLRSLLEKVGNQDTLFTTSQSTTNKPTPYGTAALKDYYLTDCISRNSPTMAKCSLAFTSRKVKSSEQLEELVQ